MTIRGSKTATPQRKLTSADHVNFTLPNGEWQIGGVLVVEDGSYTGADPQMMVSTGGLAAGAINISYLGSGHANPNTVGIQLGAGSTIYHAGNNALASATRWIWVVGRNSTGKCYWKLCPLLASSPADGSSVTTTVTTYSITAGYDTSSPFMLCSRGDNIASRLFDNSIGRLWKIDGAGLTDHEIARLAFGESILDLGKAPSFYFRLNDIGDLADQTGQVGTLAVPDTYASPTTGTDPGFAYVPAIPAPADITSNPVISGTPTVDSPIGYNPGTVAGYPVPVVTQQWVLDGADIPGATATTYQPQASDEGKTLAVRQMASNDGGNDSATSAGVVVIGVPTFSNAANELTAHRIYQRIGTTADVVVSGSYNQTPDEIEVRLYSTDGITVLQDWTALTATTIAENAWTGTLAANQGGMYRKAVRFKSGGTVLDTTPVATNQWGVGELILCAGSSSAAGWFSSGSYYETDGTFRRYKDGAWSLIPNASGGIARLVGRDLSLRLGIPVGMISTGSSGTLLSSWTNNSHALWLSFLNVINAVGGKVGALAVTMGSNDAANNDVVSRAAHAAMMRKFIADTRAALGQPNLKALWTGFNRRGDGTNNTQADYVRMAENDVGSDANVYHFPTYDMLLEAGDTGIHVASYDTTGRRWIYVFNQVLAGDTTYRRGPRISSITAWDNKFTVTLEHRSGNDITPASGNTGFTAGDDDVGTLGPLTLTAARLEAGRIELTANRAIGPNAWVKYMSGANPDVSGTTFDNGATVLPLEVAAVSPTIEFVQIAPVTGSVGWIEASEIFTAAVAVAGVTALNIGYTEAPETMSVSVNVGMTPTEVAIGWVEAPDTMLCTIDLDAPEYARAPDGPGYQPRRNPRQNRPPALQGYWK